jgi:2-amino-4-hydroxy-6-hydroxymethyldihydropteridine diphosphokinase
MSQLTNASSVIRRVLVALGSNMPEGVERSAEILRAAVGAIAGNTTAPLVVSRFYRSNAFPPGSGPDFVNAAVTFQTDLSPEVVLAKLHRIERDFGRVRRVRWGQRTLDLDLIALGDLVLPDVATLTQWLTLDPNRQLSEAPTELILPHPRLQDRAFVLLPLLDITPDWRHPLTGDSVQGMVDALPDSLCSAVIPLANSFSTP